MLILPKFPMDSVFGISVGHFRVTVTGIYRAVPLRVNPRMRNLNSVYKTHVDVVHFRKLDNKRLHGQEDGLVILIYF